MPGQNLPSTRSLRRRLSKAHKAAQTFGRRVDRGAPPDRGKPRVGLRADLFKKIFTLTIASNCGMVPIFIPQKQRDTVLRVRT